MKERLKVFVSYAHEDEQLRKELEAQLRILERTNQIRTWHDRDITAGEGWRDQVDKHLREADIILALVSADFLNSDYCYEVEMKAALEAHRKKTSILVPIILRPSAWQKSPLGELQALPTDAKPVITWDHHDSAWADVVTGLVKLIEVWRPAFGRNDSAPVEPGLILQKALTSREDMQVKSETVSQSEIERNFGSLLIQHADIASRIAAYRHEKNQCHSAAMETYDEIMKMLDSGMPIELNILLVIAKLTERKEEIIRLGTQEVGVIDAVESKGLSPGDYGLRSSLEAITALNKQMKDFTDLLAATGATMGALSKHVIKPLRELDGGHN